MSMTTTTIMREMILKKVLFMFTKISEKMIPANNLNLTIKIILDETKV